MNRIFPVAAAAALLSLASCSGKEDVKTTAQDDAPELPIVEVATVHIADVAQEKEYTATVQADNTNNIAPSVPNRIVTINAEVGDKVQKGQTLVTLDPANIDQLKVNLDHAQLEYFRAKKLLEIGAGTQQAVDQMAAQVEALKSQYKNMKDNTVLTSPITGVVTARNYDPGDMTGALPVLTVGQITPNVKVIINITENDFAQIKAGKPVTVTFDSYPGEEFAGKISRVYPTVDPATRTFQSEVLIPNPAGKILPGMFARVSLDMGHAQHVVVPDRAVVKQTGSGNKYVYVYNDGRVSYNRVELGQRLGTNYELLSGVDDGDVVVIAGQSRLADGVEVILKD